MNTYPVLLCLILTACLNKTPFENFDTAGWQNDKLACKGERQKMVKEFNLIKTDLQGLSQSDVIDVLGRPDLQVLYTRNQKFYIYFIEKGIQCEGKADASQARAVSIRFSALDSVTEIVFSDGKPI